MNLQPFEQALAALDLSAPSFDADSMRALRFAQLADFLESNVRSGQPFDLKTVQPNPLWLKIEDRLDAALRQWTRSRPPEGMWRIHQWYSSGILIDTGALKLGFDIIPFIKVFGWEDRYQLASRLAAELDALFITHRHEDHYDPEMVRACLAQGVPVYMPAALAQSWKAIPGLHAVEPDTEWKLGDLRIRARTGIHVWRDTADDLPLCIYECRQSDGRAIVYGGDADYTKFPPLSDDTQVVVYFLPWRAPNAAYEEGDPRQIAPVHVAVELGLQHIQPAYLFYVHCAELEHLYDGFTASFDIALSLKERLPVRSELMFWGESMDIQP